MFDANKLTNGQTHRQNIPQFKYVSLCINNNTNIAILACDKQWLLYKVALDLWQDDTLITNQ